MTQEEFEDANREVRFRVRNSLANALSKFRKSKRAELCLKDISLVMLAGQGSKLKLVREEIALG